MTSIKAHIDADCFYVSCERVRDSRLEGRPVGVLGNQGACVIAQSYEMREFGMKVGMPIWTAKSLCPQGVYIKRDFQWYGKLSKMMQEVLNRFSDVVEYYSIDESFLDLGNYRGDLWKLGIKIRGVMMKELNLPVSVGLSMTRILSKIAAKRGKPFGVTVLRANELERFLKSTELEDIPGIGRRLMRRAYKLGVETAFDYVNLSRRKVKEIFHKPGEQLWYELQGKPVIPIVPVRPERKALGRGGSIWGHHEDFNYIWGFLVRNLERLVPVLWHEDKEAKCVTLYLISSKIGEFKKSCILDDYTNSYEILLKTMKELYEKLYRKDISYSHVHIILTELRSANYGKQLNLFTQINEKDRLIRAFKEKLNNKFGSFTVRSAATLFVPEVFKDKTSDYEICDIDGKICF